MKHPNPDPLYRCISCTACSTRIGRRCIACGSERGWIRDPRPSVVLEAADGPRGNTADPWVVDDADQQRASSGLSGLDRVLGGGVVEGSTILLAGEPGIGKSTLLLQVLVARARAGRAVTYVAGEEPASQVAARARRLGFSSAEARLHGFQLLETTDLGAIEQVLAARSSTSRTARAPHDVVFDSVQVMRAVGHAAAPGTTAQVAEVTRQLVALCKRFGSTAWLVAHVTKAGLVAGPKALEHLVDVVSHFEGRTKEERQLTTYKNRFGAANLTTEFSMEAHGLVELPPQGPRVASVEVQFRSGRSTIVEAVVRRGAGKRIAVNLNVTRLHKAIAALWVRGIELERTDVIASLQGPALKADTEALLEVPLAVAIDAAARGEACVRRPVSAAELSLASAGAAVAEPLERLPR